MEGEIQFTILSLASFYSIIEKKRKGKIPQASQLKLESLIVYFHTLLHRVNNQGQQGQEKGKGFFFFFFFGWLGSK